MIFTIGRSLGGAVSVQLAEKVQEKICGMILENTFTSISEMVDHIFPHLTRFKNLKILFRGWRCRVLIVLINIFSQNIVIIMVEVGAAWATRDINIRLVVLAHFTRTVRGQGLMMDMLNLWISILSIILLNLISNVSADWGDWSPHIGLILKSLIKSLPRTRIERRIIKLCILFFFIGVFLLRTFILLFWLQIDFIIVSFLELNVKVIKLVIFLDLTIRLRLWLC